jgi:hypothetical protein
MTAHERAKWRRYCAGFCALLLSGCGTNGPSGSRAEEITLPYSSQSAKSLSSTIAMGDALAELLSVGDEGEITIPLSSGDGVWLSTTATLGSIPFVDKATVASKGLPDLSLGEVVLTISGSDREDAVSKLAALQKLASSGASVDCLLRGTPKFTSLAGVAFDARWVADACFVLGKSGEISFAWDGAEGEAALRAVAERLGQPIDNNLLVEWLGEFQDTGRVGQVSASIAAQSQTTLDWTKLPPRIRTFDDPEVRPPAEIAGRLRPLDVYVQVDAKWVAESPSTMVMVGSETANVHSAVVGAGTHVTRASALPDEALSVWVLDSPTATPTTPEITVASTGTLPEGLAVSLQFLDQKWHATAEPCGASTGRPCPAIAR